MSSTTSAATSSTAEERCRLFSLADIRSATGDFSEAHLVGTGGFGNVYKGFIDNGSAIVAVKRLSSNSKQGETEFKAESDTLSKLRNRNIVSLIGKCSEEEERILVYEYIANGTLADHLRKPPSSTGSSLTWNERLNICIGAARGLEYLHACKIIHRDVKSTNILLDENLVAKVSDFGLVKHLSADNLQSYVSASFKGTFGYLDPHYYYSGRVTRATDVYAFGVVLLEVLSGRKPVEGEQNLAKWAQDQIREGNVDQIVALNLRDYISEDCLKTFVELAIRCLHDEVGERPTMTQVVAQLQLALKLQENHDLIGAPTIQLMELKEATNDFSMNSLIFCGPRDELFDGVLQSGQHVAIKKLNKNRPDQEFLAQASVLVRLNHDNVVQPLGYCVDGALQILVYVFAPRGSLSDILHGRDQQGLALELGSPLSWAQRIKIAVGAAEGLHYIHENGLIHRNMRSRNVILFDDENAKISDICPSYRRFGRYGMSQRDDVRFFGVILLELLTGWAPEQRGIAWLCSIRGPAMLSEDQVHMIVDARLNRDYPPRAVEKMAAVAALCVGREADSRPDMSTVLSGLRIADWETQTHLRKQGRLRS